MDGHRQVVLVTGGSGLVGRCLQDEVDKRKRELGSRDDFACNGDFIFLSSREGDLTSYDEARQLFVKYKPTLVVHLAAKVGGLFANMADKEVGLFYKLNEQMNENILRLSFEFQVQRCLSCMSTCIFPAEVEYPLDETKVHLGPPHESNFGYAMAKRQVDLMNKQYNALRGGPPSFFAIIPTNIYGPHDNFCPRDSHVVPGLIQRAYRAAAESKGIREGCIELIVCGTGKPLRQFIYAPDVAKLILLCMTLPADLLAERTDSSAGEPSIILCPDERLEVSIGQVAELIARHIGRIFVVNMQVKYESSAAEVNSDGQFKKTASNGKLRRLFPSFEFTPLERGLEQTIDWFRANYPHRVRGLAKV